MSAPVSRAAVVAALLRKELKAYSRDKLYVFLTLLTLIAVVVMFRFLPDSVDETLTLAVSPPLATVIEDARGALSAMGVTPEQLAELDEADLATEEGLELVEFEDPSQMSAVIEGRLEAWRGADGELMLRDLDSGDPKPDGADRVDVSVGIAFPERFVADLTASRKVSVKIYSDAGVPGEIRDAVRGIVREVGYGLAGRGLPVTVPDEETVILGEDRSGDQMTLRQKFRPMIIFMVLLMETFSLVSLVSIEVLQRTVTAVLVTPARISDFLAAKAIFGTLMAFGQGLLVALLVGGFNADNWSLMLTVLLLGAMMFTGAALMIGAAGKDFLGQLFYAMGFTVPMIVPTFAVLFPGTAAPWVKAIPTYPIIELMVRTMDYGATWGDSWSLLSYAAAWLAVLFAGGLLVLRRKVATL